MNFVINYQDGHSPALVDSEFSVGSRDKRGFGLNVYILNNDKINNSNYFWFIILLYFSPLKITFGRFTVPYDSSPRRRRRPGRGHGRGRRRRRSRSRTRGRLFCWLESEESLWAARDKKDR